MTQFHSDNYRTQPDAEDLKLYAENFSGTHFNNLGRLLTKKFKRDDFNYYKACLACERYLVTPAAKDYGKAHLGWGAGKWFKVMPKPMREAVATQIVDGLLDEFRLGNFWEVVK